MAAKDTAVVDSTTHPAADLDVRAGTTDVQNQIDLNDPDMPGHEAVEKNLAAQAAK